MRTSRTPLAIVVVAGILTFLVGCRRAAEDARSYAGAPVIIISIDTLRADHLPLYGYKHVDTPNLEALRDDSMLFTNAYSNVPLTLPSHVAMLTGLLPPQNKVRNNIGYHLDETIVTIPRALKARGYETGAAVSSYVLRGNVGLAAAFDFYEDGIVNKADVAVGSLQRSGSETAEVATSWLHERRSRPHFFFLHLFEPHSPYEPPEPFRSKYPNSYDGEIAAVDQIVGSFISRLKKDGIYDRAILILMSDHGEGLYQHGEPEHGIFLYREAIHVPLMLKLPARARAGETVRSPVSLIDIFPTVAELCDLPLPANLKGKSLLRAEDPPRTVYSETLYPRIHLGWSELRSLVNDKHHFIEAPRPELYEVTRDPGETTNVLSNERRVYTALREELSNYGAEVELPTSIDPEEAKRLAALGYLGSTQAAPAGPLPDPKERIGEIAEMMNAMRHVTKNDHVAAVAAFRKVLEKNPRLADAWNQMGSSLETLGRYEEAVAAYQQAIRTTPELAGEFGLRLGSALLKLDRFEEAADHARLGEKVNHGGSHVLLARIALARKDYRRAEAEARQAEQDQYSRLPAMVLRAQILAQQERAGEALALVDHVVAEAERRRLGPIESLEYVRGDALARLQRHGEAIKAFRREIAAFPRNRQTYASLYLVYMLTDRRVEARRALEAMVMANRTRRAFLFAAQTADAIGDHAAGGIWRRRAASID